LAQVQTRTILLCDLTIPVNAFLHYGCDHRPQMVCIGNADSGLTWQRRDGRLSRLSRPHGKAEAIFDLLDAEENADVHLTERSLRSLLAHTFQG
jgi:hypothetical protein